MGHVKVRQSLTSASKAEQTGRIRISATFIANTVIIVLILNAVSLSVSVFMLIAVTEGTLKKQISPVFQSYEEAL